MKISTARVPLLLLTAGTLVLSACGGDDAPTTPAATGGDDTATVAAEPRDVTFMMFLGQSYRLPVLVAKDQGYFEESNINVDYVEQPAQLQGIQGLDATGADVGQVTVGTLAQGVQAGSEAKFFCGGIDVLQTTLMAPLDSDLPSAEDGATWEDVLKSLEGKNIGIQTPEGSGLQKIFAEALQEVGVTNVNYVNLGGSTQAAIAAVENKSVDVVQANPSGTQFLSVNERAKPLLYMADGPKVYAENYGSAWVAPTEWLDENPELATEVCEILGRGLEFIQDPANKDVASQILQEDTNLEPEVADLVIEQAYGDYSIEMPEDVLTNTFDTYVRLGILEQEPNPTYDLLVDDLSGSQ